jgi:DNA-binding MarR family transcriptional regulator
VVTYRVNQLVERGMVDRNTKPDDRRVILLSLTPAGMAIVDAVMTTMVAKLGDRLSAVDEFPGAREQLQRLLSALARRWEQLDAQELLAPASDD